MNVSDDEEESDSALMIFTKYMLYLASVLLFIYVFILLLMLCLKILYFLTDHIYNTHKIIEYEEDIQEQNINHSISENNNLGPEQKNKERLLLLLNKYH